MGAVAKMRPVLAALVILTPKVKAVWPIATPGTGARPHAGRGEGNGPRRRALRFGRHRPVAPRRRRRGTGRRAPGAHTGDAGGDPEPGRTRPGSRGKWGPTRRSTKRCPVGHDLLPQEALGIENLIHPIEGKVPSHGSPHRPGPLP